MGCVFNGIGIFSSVDYILYKLLKLCEEVLCIKPRVVLRRSLYDPSYWRFCSENGLLFEKFEVTRIFRKLGQTKL
jgi:hypothetical protein